jgi:uncharacterized protein (TIGR03083 family)
MNRDDIWRAMDAQRLRLAALLDELTDDEWLQASLCDGWTVRDVAAHLTLQQLGLGQVPSVLAAVARARGNLDRATHDMARRRAATTPTTQLIAEIRGMVGSRRYNLGGTPLEPLIDALVHGQDIALPLGRSLHTPPDAAAVAATRLWTMKWPPPIPATRKLRGYRFVATDVDWAVGEGPEVSGPMEAVLLVLTGRSVALPRLRGEGAAAIAERLASATT